MADHDQAQILSMARELVAQEWVITLATADGGQPWAAPVYYAFHDGGFFFFSSPDSRHIRQGLAVGQTAAAIHARADSWQGIRGLQMSGRVRAVKPGIRAAKAVKAYAKRFPFVREFFSAGQSMDLEAFARRFRVRLYEFKADLVYYQDNSVEFGFREEIEL
jgi:hypothetical protein